MVIMLPRASRLRVGSLGIVEFPAGAYVYVGSALGGIEQRVARHMRPSKRMRWHIDYLLRKGRVISVFSVPSEKKSTECALATALATVDGAAVYPGFGSSDCRCVSHLIHFGETELEQVMETISMKLAMLDSAYPRVKHTR